MTYLSLCNVYTHMCTLTDELKYEYLLNKVLLLYVAANTSYPDMEST